MIQIQILKNQDSLLSISSFLSIHDIRNLASTCRSIRETLLSTEAATKQIWVNRMIDLFPHVGRRITDPSITRVGDSVASSIRTTFEIDHSFVLSRISGGDECELNFPLITSLVPTRYPQSIDPKTFISDNGTQTFRTYVGKMSLIKSLDKQTLEIGNHDPMCSLIQYLGRVGTGNRSIRSDAPFPSNGREVSSSGSDTKIGGFCFRSQTFLSSPSLLDLPLPSEYCNSTSTTSSNNCNSISCLHYSHSYGPFSIEENECTSPSNGGSSSSSSSNDNNEMNCTNNNRMNAGNTILYTLRQRLSNVLFGAGKAKTLRMPFIVPTVISETRSADYNQFINLLVDVTPRMILYFEITLLHHDLHSSTSEQIRHDPRRECVAVGLSTKSFQTQCSMPGWDAESYGYHSDDGGMFHGKGVAVRFGRPTFGLGDTIGCGLEYTSRRIFFTKNNQFLGFEFGILQKQIIEKGLYPTVGVDTNCPIWVNFGAHPFTFDLKNIKDHAPVSKRPSMLNKVVSSRF